jgi:hypothetical protein
MMEGIFSPWCRLYRQEDVAIGELRVQNFTEMDITEIKHEINVLK